MNIKRSVLHIAVVCGLVVTTLALTSTANASVGKVRITNLVREQTVPSGWWGPIKFDFSRAQSGRYDLGLKCSGRWVKDTAFTYRQGEPNFEMRIPALKAGTCYVVISDASRTRNMRFFVAPPPLAPPQVSRDLAVFYPYVRDGYRDDVTFDYMVSRPARVSLVILNSANKAVRRVSLDRPKGWHSWTWNGRSDWNSMAPVGDYRLRVTVTADDQSRSVIAPPVSVRRGTLDWVTWYSKWGHQGWPSTKGKCYISRDGYYGTALLDCWGGRYAQMTYTFAIPSHARNIRFGVGGDWSSADFCCNGRLSKVGKRISSTRYRVTVKVNGWRAYYIDRVTIKYDHYEAARVTGQPNTTRRGTSPGQPM